MGHRPARPMGRRLVLAVAYLLGCCVLAPFLSGPLVHVRADPFQLKGPVRASFCLPVLSLQNRVYLKEHLPLLSARS